VPVSQSPRKVVSSATIVFGDCQQAEALIDSSLRTIVGITPLNAVRSAGISEMTTNWRGSVGHDQQKELS
jgi:hypothetical protein